MKKRTYFQLLAASTRAEMRHHALYWRAEKSNQSPNQVISESIKATALDCAKTYNKIAREYDALKEEA